VVGSITFSETVAALYLSMDSSNSGVAEGYAMGGQASHRRIWVSRNIIGYVQRVQAVYADEQNVFNFMSAQFIVGAGGYASEQDRAENKCSKYFLQEILLYLECHRASDSPGAQR
jgi:hypothetical protein